VRSDLAASLLLLGLGSAGAAPVTAGWELRRDDLEPATHRPPVENGTVTVTVGETPAMFPRHLNELGIERIRVRFTGVGAQPRKLSVVWTGGTMGPDGFEVRVDGVPVGTSQTVDTARYPDMWQRDEFVFTLSPFADHVIEITSPSELRSAIQFVGIRLGAPDEGNWQPLCRTSIGTLERYESAIGAPGALIEREHLWVFAPRDHAGTAGELAALLEQAHEVMREIFGTDMVFKFSVEIYPEGHERGWGGIGGEATIGYPLQALDRFQRLGTGDVRGIAGFTEEMSHGFKALFRCHGTYEALGLAVLEDVVRQLVAPEIADRHWLREHAKWEETHRAYLAAGRQNPDPERYPWNVLYTRILNSVFLQMREEYGPEMWPDFFDLLRERDFPLHRAGRVELMSVYADLFSELLGRDMRRQFTEWGIDLDVDPPWGWQTHAPPSVDD
jgi:hypothetical protein